MHQERVCVLHVHSLNWLQMLRWCGLMKGGNVCEFWGSMCLDSFYQRKELAEGFIRIPHMKTFYCKESISELHLPKISKGKTFEIDPRTPAQETRFHTHGWEAHATYTTSKGALTQNDPLKVQQKSYLLCPESGMFQSIISSWKCWALVQREHRYLQLYMKFCHK